MKANTCGTMTEQIMARIGFKTATERKACGADLKKTCSACEFSFNEAFTNRDGGAGVSFRCRHVRGGFATRPSAGCDFWEGKKVQL